MTVTSHGSTLASPPPEYTSHPSTLEFAPIDRGSVVVSNVFGSGIYLVSTILANRMPTP